MLVLDASGALEVALDGEQSQEFRTILSRAAVVIAPDTFPSEIINTFWKYHRFANMPAATCEKGIQFCLDLIDDYIDTRSLSLEVFAEAAKLKHPAYDLFYLITARRNSAGLLTKDQKVLSLAKQMGLKEIT